MQSFITYSSEVLAMFLEKRESKSVNSNGLYTSSKLSECTALEPDSELQEVLAAE